MKKVLRNLYVRLFLSAFALYSLLGFLLLPFLVQHYLPAVVEKSLGTHATLSKVFFNPYTFQLQLDDFVIQDISHETLGYFKTFRADFEPAALFGGKLIFKELYMKQLKINVKVGETGVYNFQHIIDHLARATEPDGESNASMIGVRVSKIALEDSRILFEDDSQEEPFIVETKPFDFQLNDFSTVVNEEGTLRFMIATQDTGTVQSSASISLQPFQIKGDFAVDDFNINKLYSYIKESVDFRLEGNKLSAKVGYGLLYKEGRLSVDILGAQIDIGALAYGDANRTAGFSMLKSGIEAIRLVKTQHAFETKLEGFTLQVDGLDYNDTLGRTASAGHVENHLESAVLEQNASAPLQLGLKGYGLALDGVHYKDSAAVQAGIAGIKTGFNRFELSKGELLSGDLQTFHAALNGIAYGDRNNALTMESADFSLPSLRIDNDLAVAARLASFDLKTIRLNNRKKELLEMKSIVLSDLFADTAADEYNITKIVLDEGMMTLRLYSDLKTDLDYLLPETPKKEDAVRKVDNSAGAKPKLNIKDLWLNNARFTFNDLRTRPVTLTANRINAHIQNATLDETRTIPYDFSFGTPKAGGMSGWGNVRQKPLSVSLDLSAKRVDLRPYMPYVQEFVNLEMNSSLLSSRLKIRYAQRKEPELAFNGELTLQDIDLAHSKSGQRLFGVKELALHKIRFEKDHLAVNEVVIESPYAKIAIDENRSTNFDGLMVSKEAAQRKRETVPQAKAEEGKAASFLIAQLIFKNGTMDFSDFSLPLRFKTRVDKLEGDVFAISSDLDELMRIKLDGTVDKYGVATIGGTLIAADPTKQTDVTVDFKNIDVTSLSPYTGKFIGRTIKNGKLWLDLGYKIDEGQLQSTNDIKMKDLELGEKVESEEATSLPLELAIALLKDSDGYIDVSLPVEGDVNNPDFKYGGAVWKAVGNLIVGIAASPFKFLGSALGINAEELAMISFDYGSAALAPPEKEKLDKLIDLFVKRPGIGLVVAPGYMPSLDRAALQKQKFFTLALARFKEDSDSGSKQKFVKKLYIETLGTEHYDKEAEALKASLKEGDDFNSLFFDRQVKELTALQNVTEAELNELALARSRTIIEHLLSQGFDAGRIREETPVKAEGNADAEQFELQLGIDVK